MRRTGALLVGVAVILAALAAGRDAFDRWVGATILPPLVVEQSVEVLDREGRLLRAFTVADGLWRLGVRPGGVDPLFLEMLVAYEDRRFWVHDGVDPRALVRAAWLALRNGRVVSGGSTLSMQTARLLEDGTTGALGGKLRQMRVAMALERRLDKRQILALYQELAPYGGNLEGVRSASFAYFGKEPDRLTPAEAALLVALPQAPESRRPDRNPETALTGRNRVLSRMERDGIIDAETAAAARREAIPSARRPFPAHAAHLADRLRAEAPLQRVHGTALDRDLQASLEALALDAAQRVGARMSAAIVVADHASGAVLAHVGAARYVSDARQGWVDMTTAARSPGSTLKPLVYGLAFELGLAHPDTMIEDRPLTFDGYAPINFDGVFHGPVRAAAALQMSLNVPVVALAQAVGPVRVLARLRRAGAEPKMPGGTLPGLAVALGGVGLTLEELVALYGAIARGGAPLPLHWREEGPEVSGMSMVLSEGAAWQVAHVLSQVPPPPHAPSVPLAYKTGTSYGHRDAWALGFDGRHVAGVWVGRADGTAVPGISGAETAAPVLFEAFSRLKARPTPLPASPPGVLPGPTSALPPPLKRFRGARNETPEPEDMPKLAFPLDGTTLEVGTELPLRVRDGVPPFTWLADGTPVAVAVRRRDTMVALPAGMGPMRLVVVDGVGRSAEARVTLVSPASGSVQDRR